MESPASTRARHRAARSRNVASRDDAAKRAAEAGASQPNVSQHLAVLRAAGLVEAERDGREVRYRLSDPDVLVACGIMRAVLERRLTRLAALSNPTSTPTPAPQPMTELPA